MEREESPLREAWGKSRWKRWGTRALSWMLVLAILMPPHGRAEYTEILPEGGLCVHHPAHTEECGYVEAGAGSPCMHVHDESCGYGTPEEPGDSENPENPGTPEEPENPAPCSSRGARRHRGSR